MPFTSRPRRVVTALAAAALVGGAGVAGAGVAAAAPPPGTVVGTWSASVVIRMPSGNVTGTSTLTFAPGGRFCLKTDTSTGKGTWTQGGQAVAYRATERQNDPSLGSVKLNQAGRQQGNSLRSSGVSLVYNAAGKQTGTAFSQVTATRTSTSTSGC